MNKLKSLMHGALAPVLVLLVWEACARAGLFSAVVMPAPITKPAITRYRLE